MNKFKAYYQKYRLYVWPVCVALSSLAILALVIIPQLLRYVEVNGNIGQLKKQTSALEVKAKELEQIDDNLNQNNLKVVFTVLPKDQDVPMAMSVLQDTVNKSGVLMREVSYASARTVGNRKSFQLNVGISGDLIAIREFLNSLKQSSLIFQIESINAQFQKGTSQIQADIPISVFYDPSTGGGKAVSEAPVPKLTSKEEQLLSRLAEQLPETVIETGEDSISVPLGKTDPFE